jgi:hypothetical protein
MNNQLIIVVNPLENSKIHISLNIHGLNKIIIGLAIVLMVMKTKHAANSAEYSEIDKP